MPSRMRDIVDWALFGPDPTVTTTYPAVRESLSGNDSKGRPLVSSQELPVLRPGPRQPHPAVALWNALWHRDQHTWSPRALQIRPLVRIAAICVTVGCVFASFVVLRLSDGQATGDWALSPSIALAIITAVSNSAIALAHRGSRGM
jgi:hypothetical protein